jgi:hypothetical protein
VEGDLEACSAATGAVNWPEKGGRCGECSSRRGDALILGGRRASSRSTLTAAYPSGPMEGFRVLLQDHPPQFGQCCTAVRKGKQCYFHTMNCRTGAVLESVHGA